MNSCIIFHFEAVSSENALVSQTAIKDLASPGGCSRGPARLRSGSAPTAEEP